MPKARIKVGDFSGVKGAKGFNNYAGPVPPKGVYACRVKLWRLVENRSGDPMFKILFEVDESGDKAKYNGYAIWHNANLTERSAPFVNAMLEALDLDPRGVWKNSGAGILLSQEKPEDVVSIARTKVIGLKVLVVAKREQFPATTGEWSLKAVSFSPLNEGDEHGREDEEAGSYEEDDADLDPAGYEPEPDDGDGDDPF